MAFPEHRLRRLRRSAELRRLVRETHVEPGDLIYPLFCVTGRGVREPVVSMPGVDRLSVDQLAAEAKDIQALGLAAVILFGIPDHKDALGSAGEVGAGVVLRVADGEVDLPLQDLGQEFLLLGLTSKAPQRRADGVEREEGEGKARALNFVGEDPLIDGRATLPAVFGGPADPEQSVAPHLLERLGIERSPTLAAADLVDHFGSNELFEVAPDFLLKFFLLGGEVDAHGVSLGRPWRKVERVLVSVCPGSRVM